MFVFVYILQPSLTYRVLLPPSLTYRVHLTQYMIAQAQAPPKWLADRGQACFWDFSRRAELLCPRTYAGSTLQKFLRRNQKAACWKLIPLLFPLVLTLTGSCTISLLLNFVTSFPFRATLLSFVKMGVLKIITRRSLGKSTPSSFFTPNWCIY